MLTMKERIEEHRNEARNTKVVECVEGHYQSEKVPFGRVYRWCAECVVVECGCGERVTLASSMTTCARCGTEHSVTVQERLPTERVAQDEKALHPWRLVRDCQGESLPC